MHFVSVKDLPNTVQQVLRGVGYHKADIAVHTATETSIQSGAAFTGSRGFCAVLDMATGVGKTQYGSWGGANPFERHAVDVNETKAPIPQNVCVIKGESGGRGTFARLIVRPDAMPALLPAAAAPEVTPAQLRTVEVIRSTKSGAYRVNELQSIKFDYDALIDSCVALGYLKRNKIGAVSITTQGRNLCEMYRVDVHGNVERRS